MSSRPVSFDMIIKRLGGDLPSWKREWVAEAELFGGRAGRREITAAMEYFAKADGMRVDIRSKGDARYWLLARAPQTTLTGKPARASAHSRGRSDLPSASPAEDVESDEVGGEYDEGPDDCTPEAVSTPVPEPRIEQPRPPSEIGRPASDEASRLAGILRAIGIRIIEVNPRPTLGPTFTRYEILLPPNERTETLRRRAEDIGRELGASIQISHLPGDRHVAIDVPREDRQLVSLLPILDQLKRGVRPAELRILVGVAPTGQPISVDLAMLPHILLAGASGSGKSMWLLIALLCLVASMGADALDLIIIDPKGLDFGPLARLPHVRNQAIIEDPADAIEVLREITGPELAMRTRLLQEVGCANFRELRLRRPDVAAKHLVVAIDEYADIVTSLPREERDDFERQVLRLAQRARAVGVHLMVATQRPTVDLITGAVKANLPSRISFRLPQRADSLVILDQPGAESLLGAGDMLLLHEGALQRLQGYHASTLEVVELVKRIVEGRAP